MTPQRCATSFQKTFGLCGLNGHLVENWWDVTFVDDTRTECEDRARILDSEFATVVFVATTLLMQPRPTNQINRICLAQQTNISNNQIKIKTKQQILPCFSKILWEKMQIFLFL